MKAAEVGRRLGLCVCPSALIILRLASSVFSCWMSDAVMSRYIQRIHSVHSCVIQQGLR